MLKTFRYIEIADDLQQKIEEGGVERLKLPSERALMARYGVQRDTVRRALLVLRDRGTIVSSGKRRSFVNAVPNSGGDGAEAAELEGTILVITRLNEASTALESLLRGLSGSVADTKLSLLYFDSRPKQGRTTNELPSDEFLAARGIVGIVLWPQSPADIDALYRLRSYAPLVLVDRQVSGFETHSVVFDDFHGARALTEHLVGLGRRRIGFLADEVFAETVQQRWRGYTQALEDADIMPDSTCFALFQIMDGPNYGEQIQILLKGAGDPLTAVVCSNDTVALGLLNHLRAQGRRVPEDVAVTGFGNLLPSSMAAVGLTTVVQPFEEAGKEVGRILRRRIGGPVGPDASSRFEHVEVPVRLVVRASSESED